MTVHQKGRTWVHQEKSRDAETKLHSWRDDDFVASKRGSTTIGISYLLACQRLKNGGRVKGEKPTIKFEGTSTYRLQVVSFRVT